MQVEVCAYSLESCLNAQAAGAHRVELCGGLGEGGTTPSAGLIGLVRERVELALYVMVRPRGGDFVYDALEEEVIRRDIDVAKKYGADGVVLGVLTAQGQVDVVRTRALIDYAQPLGVTFHRAFDLTPDPLEALERVIEAGAERILTSGQRASAPEGLDVLRQLVIAASGRIEIMAGGGVNAGNAAQLAATGIQALHLTGKAFRPGRQQYFPAGISMAGEVPDERSILYSKLESLRELVEAVR
ncbi:copper homeostasis protein CutC [Rhabdobacter roseus]|uniref:PF03932 family protein CutC n=1 Tax=Rhabdobacter roseus TaxID=1655419 RepID=A0A840TKR6_9BACT|nr:copper homeostasis protein CutC [Rhabdobacter roseus]MBB5282152.1 copper homeostasis protein [Rhabdobacter roseus]